MCSSKLSKVTAGMHLVVPPGTPPLKARPALHPPCNRVPCGLERNNSLKKPLLCSPSPTLAISGHTPAKAKASSTPPLSPKSKSPRPPATKRSNDGNGFNLSSEKVVIPGGNGKGKTLERKKSKSFKGNAVYGGVGGEVCPSGEALLSSYSSSLITDSPGRIAAVRREQVALQQAQRKMKIAHYGRSKSARFEKVVPFDLSTTATNKTIGEEKRCSFITGNTDPIYVAYHDEEWGVPVHVDQMLFELLVLSVAQVGSDWTSILKKRHDFRSAFSGFDAETVAKFNDSRMLSITSAYAIEISRVRGIVDNSNRILEIKKEFGSFDKYMWGFVNDKPMSTHYKSVNKIPVKTSKSESMSKDMVKRGFRFVGPTVLHSFMQAAGLTNDHLTTCHRHLQCTLLASTPPSPPT